MQKRSFRISIEIPENNSLKDARWVYLPSEFAAFEVFGIFYIFIYYNYNLMAKKKLRIHRIKSHEEEVEEELRSLKIKNTTLN